MVEQQQAQKEWAPEYERWRHGGWYVVNIDHPGNAAGCVSNNYPDKKWRVACAPEEFTFPSRDAAARAERLWAYERCKQADALKDIQDAIAKEGAHKALEIIKNLLKD